jgi:hypothetical protein
MNLRRGRGEREERGWDGIVGCLVIGRGKRWRDEVKVGTRMEFSRAVPGKREERRKYGILRSSTTVSNN